MSSHCSTSYLSDLMDTTPTDITPTDITSLDINLDPRNIMDKKLFIFDFDDTIYLHNIPTYENEIYLFQMLKLFDYLKNNNKILAIASTNQYVEDELYSIFGLSYSNYFDIIIGERYHKKYMFPKILEHTKCLPSDTIFFDDLKKNTDQANSLGITTYHVTSKYGIDLEKLFPQIQNNITYTLNQN